MFGGSLYGPYKYGIRESRVWMLRGRQLLEALPYFDKWLPPSRKREQYLAWRQRYPMYFEPLDHVSRFTVGNRRRARFHD